MADHLVIRLQPGRVPAAEWVVVDPAGVRPATRSSGELAEAAADAAPPRRVVVLVPGEDVLLTHINLPVRGSQRMLQAVPFAMEDHLADDVGELHFALGRRAESGEVSVAATRRECMEAWLAELAEAGISPQALHPDTAGVPVSAGETTLLVDGERAMLRRGDGAPTACSIEEMPAFAAALGSEDSAENRLRLHVADEDRERFATEIAAVAAALGEQELHRLGAGALELLARTVVEDEAPNLLQGAYAQASGAEKLWRPWRAAAVLAAAVLLTALGGKALEVFALKSQERALFASVQQIAAEVLPAGSRIPPGSELQLVANLLGDLRGGSAADGTFLDMLGALASAVAEIQGVTIRELDFRSGVMGLTLMAPDVGTLDRLRATVAERGRLNAEIQSTSQRDGSIEGRLRLQRP